MDSDDRVTERAAIKRAFWTSVADWLDIRLHCAALTFAYRLLRRLHADTHTLGAHTASGFARRRRRSLFSGVSPGDRPGVSYVTTRVAGCKVRRRVVKYIFLSLWRSTALNARLSFSRVAERRRFNGVVKGPCQKDKGGLAAHDLPELPSFPFSTTAILSLRDQLRRAVAMAY